METFTVVRDNDADLKFTGECIARASSSHDRASSSFESTGRWTVLSLYKTKGGKLVCEQIGYSQWQGESERCSGAVCETEQEVIAFFGHGWLAKELYCDAGIVDASDID